MGLKKILIWIISVIIVATLISIFIIPKITAQEIQTSQEMEDYKNIVEKANSGFWDWLFARQAVTGGATYWSACERTCIMFTFSGDCDPCLLGETESNCVWGGDQQSAYPGWSSASAYCNDWLKPFPDYNKQCYCSVPQQECTGGASPGDKKCSSGEVWRCNSDGVWEMDEDCAYTCENSQCVGECSSDSDCGQDDYLGSKFCQNNNVFQKYREYDCSDYSCSYSEEDRLMDDCASNENCINGECVSSCQSKTCLQLGFDCGLQDDGCGNEINCGTCSPGYNCISGICKIGSCTPSCVGKKCGSDGCGGNCGTCEAGKICDNGICIEEIIQDCIANPDCKSLAEVICDDESLWYKSYSCINGKCSIGKEIPPETCISEETKEAGYVLQIAIGIIIVFIIGIIGFGIYKWRK